MHIFYSRTLDRGVFTLDESESIHLARVLRLRAGDEATIIDGSGTLYRCRVLKPDKKSARLEVISTEESYLRRDYYLHIAIAPMKSTDRYEWFLEKSVELGIDRITPIICERSERHTTKTERSRKVIISAMKQSLKAYLPVLGEATSFKNFIKENLQGERFIAYIDENQQVHLKEGYRGTGKVTILIGPEGDFSKEEFEAAQKVGFKPVTLGPERLRTETAALYACFAINFIHQKSVSKK